MVKIRLIMMRRKTVVPRAKIRAIVASLFMKNANMKSPKKKAVKKAAKWKATLRKTSRPSYFF